MAWISVYEQIRDHPKTREFARILPCNRHEAIGILVCLWLWGINNADRDGVIISATEQDIADGIMYREMSHGQSAKKLMDCLIKSGWVDYDTDHNQFILHDWDEWQEQWYKALDRRASEAERKRGQRKKDTMSHGQSAGQSQGQSAGPAQHNRNRNRNQTVTVTDIEEPNGSSCEELSAAADPPRRNTILSLTLNDKTEYPVYEDQVKQWENLYPAVDVSQQLRAMKGWLDANPTKRKTKKGIMRFINGWLSKEQDKGGPRRETEPLRNERTVRANGAQQSSFNTEGMAGFQNALDRYTSDE